MKYNKKHSNTSGPDSDNLSHSTPMPAITLFTRSDKMWTCRILPVMWLVQSQSRGKNTIKNLPCALPIPDLWFTLHSLYLRIKCGDMNLHRSHTTGQVISCLFQKQPKAIFMLLHIIVTLFYKLFVFISSIFLLWDWLLVQYWQTCVLEELTLLFGRQTEINETKTALQ